MDDRDRQKELLELATALENEARFRATLGLAPYPARRQGAAEEPRPPLASPPLAAAASSPSPALAGMGQSLEELRAYLGDCTRCKLCRARTQVVFGCGNPQAELMFVGEGPGYDEDQQGQPFVGRAGQLLTKMIKAMGYERPAVYIANVVKCRPPENRTPEGDEVATCSPFLLRQIELIRPQVLVALGKVAAQTLLSTDRRITSLRGQWGDFRGTPLMPTFHPAYLLRNEGAKRETWEDLKKVMARLGRQP